MSPANHVPQEKAAMRSTAAADTTGVMIALVPSGSATSRLMEASGATEPVEEQHITLAYLGTLGEEVPDDETTRDRLFNTVASAAVQYAPLNGDVSGWGVFNNEEDTLVALWSIPGVNGLRQRLVEDLRDVGLMVKNTYSFNPHQTMSYADPGSLSLPKRLDPKVTSDFRSLYITWGGQWHEVPLSGVRHEARSVPSPREAAMSTVKTAAKSEYVILPKSDPQAAFEAIKTMLGGGSEHTADRQYTRGGNPDNPGQFSSQDRGHRKKTKTPQDKKKKPSGGGTQQQTQQDQQAPSSGRQAPSGQQSTPSNIAQVALEKAMASGGFSMRDASGEGPQGGYMIALDKGTEKTLPIEGLTVEQIEEFFEQHADLLSDENKYLGGWVEQGQLYLDISTNMDDLDEVMDLARENSQIGVWDVAGGKTIYTEEHFGGQQAAEGVPEGQQGTQEPPAEGGPAPPADPAGQAATRQALEDLGVEVVIEPQFADGDYTATAYSEVYSGAPLSDEQKAAVGDMYGQYLPQGRYLEGDPRNEPEFEAILAEKTALSDHYAYKSVPFTWDPGSKDDARRAWTDPANWQAAEEWRANGTGGQTEDLYNRIYVGEGRDTKASVWTAERSRMHQKIIKDMTERYKDYPREGKAIVMAGPPGAGKSTALNNFGKEAFGIDVASKEEQKAGAPPAHNYVTINPDDFKEVIEVDLDRYPGMGEHELAAMKHEESSFLAERATEWFMARGYNVIIDITLGKESSATRKYYTPYEGSYDYQVLLVDGDMANSRNNAGLRYKKPDKNGQRTYQGRFLPMSLIESNAPNVEGFRSKNASEFTKFIKHPKVSQAYVYDPYNPSAGLQGADAAIRRTSALSDRLIVTKEGSVNYYQTQHQTTDITRKIEEWRNGQATEDALVQTLANWNYASNEENPHTPGTADWWEWHEDNGYQAGTFDEVLLATNTGLLPWRVFNRVNDALEAAFRKKMSGGA